MNEIYLQLRKEARVLISQMPDPEFCRRFAREILFSRQMLHSDPLLVRLKKEINPILDDDFGHGIYHSDLVSVDAGAIIQVERGYSPDEAGGGCSDALLKEMRMVQVAGLLHDIKRKEPEHAIKGGEFARTFLTEGGYPLSFQEIESIALAIEVHEAFQKKTVQQPPLISNALYDADKFRWGPDNFTHTVWEMVMFANVPLQEFVNRYPNGLNALQKIKQTFRSATGKQYGPNFIDIGITVGNTLFKIIKQKHPDCFTQAE